MLDKENARFNPSKDPRHGRNHYMTKNPNVTQCGKRNTNGFEPYNEDYPMCERCLTQHNPPSELRVHIPKGGWANGVYYREGAGIARVGEKVFKH